MKHVDLLKRLLPPVSYQVNETELSGQLSIEGSVLDNSEQSVNNIAVTPFNAGALIVDWERVLGLKPSDNDSYQMRLERVLAKLAETGGLSIPYFIGIARAAGYDIEILEPEPFRAGRNRCGDGVFGDDVIFTWQVNVKNQIDKRIYFRAGAGAAGERLMFASDTIIESVFNDLKPAHTFCYFAYLGD